MERSLPCRPSPSFTGYVADFVGSIIALMAAAIAITQIALMMWLLEYETMLAILV